MKPATLDKKYRRITRRRQGEQGLTIIELLLSLTILVLLTSFLGGGLNIARRAYDSSRKAQVGSEADSAIQAISMLVGSAVHVPALISNQPTNILFEGDKNSISFVGMSEGRSLQGGLYKIIVRRIGTDLVVDLTPLVAKSNQQQRNATTVVLDGLRGVCFSYFGKLDASTQPVWRSEWHQAEMLPLLVAIQINFEDESRVEPATIIALRQG